MPWSKKYRNNGVECETFERKNRASIKKLDLKVRIISEISLHFQIDNFIGVFRISDCKWYSQFTPGFDHDYVNHIVAISDFVS